MDYTTFLKDKNYLSNPLNLFAISTILFLVFVVKQTKLFSSKSIKNLPPGPPRLPIIGNLHQVGDNPHVSTAKFAKKYGPLISVHLGQELVVVASSPEAAMGILKTQDRLLSSRTVPAAFQQESLIPHSLIWADTNQTWKALRTLCRTELFSAKALEAQARIKEEKVGHMLAFLRRKQGQVIDVQDIVFTTLLNTLSSIVFSRDMLEFAGEQDWLKESMHKVIGYGSRIKDFGSFFPILERFDLHGTTRGTMKVFEKVFAYWEEIIEERRAVVNSPTWSSEQAQSFLDRMLENKFSSNQIYQLVMELFVAGTNTTTCTVIWVMSELLRHNEVMSKVEKEMKIEINSDEINISQLSKLTYLQACIKETFRVHPPVPLLLPHKAAETCEVMNYTIPFGSGRRICPGLPSGIKSVELILASLIREFNWTLPNGDDPLKLDMNEKFGIAMKRENPLKLIFKQK